MPRRCYAQASRSSTRCAIRERAPGDLVAVQGIGGLGHLGIQYARQMGFRTFAIGRGQRQRTARAQTRRVWHYVDTAAGNPVAELQKFGGARHHSSHRPRCESRCRLFDGLSSKRQASGRRRQRSMPLTVTPDSTYQRPQALQGWASGTAMDSEDTMNFSAITEFVR
jgi:D-arabinose 1-dehydrogenase-like Zn-dependent alcohol dehydrogenase